AVPSHASLRLSLGCSGATGSASALLLRPPCSPPPHAYRSLIAPPPRPPSACGLAQPAPHRLFDRINRINGMKNSPFQSIPSILFILSNSLPHSPLQIPNSFP